MARERAYGFKDHKCPVCGKMFLPAPYHKWWDNEKLFCTYSCYCRHLDKKKKPFKGMPVEQYTPSGKYIRTFPTAADAALAVGLCHANLIRECCRGKQKTSGGFVWRYKREEAPTDPVESLG